MPRRQNVKKNKRKRRRRKEDEGKDRGGTKRNEPDTTKPPFPSSYASCYKNH